MQIPNFKTNNMIISAGSSPTTWLERLKYWEETGIEARIRQRDGRVWDETLAAGTQVPELTDRLDWLELPETMIGAVTELLSFADEIIAAGFNRVVVLGMGGSSLIAEVWAKIFSVKPGFLPVAILDSTHPVSVVRIAAAGDLTSTLFLVASKSGGTLETISFFNFFYDKVSRIKDNPGANFVALTDPGSKLEKLAQEKGFRRIFSTPTAVGGRFSALTYFGLLPAVLQGAPIAAVAISKHQISRPRSILSANSIKAKGSLDF